MDRVLALAASRRTDGEDWRELTEIFDEAKATAAKHELFLSALALADWPGGALHDWIPAAELQVIANEVEVEAGPEWSAYAISQLAQAYVLAGRLEDADRIVRIRLDGRAERRNRWTAPRLWLLRAEIARKQGDWARADACLGRMELAVVALEELENDDPELLTVRREPRVRLHTARAANLLELGLLDRVQEELALARLAAERPGVPLEAEAAVRQLEIDRLLLSRRFAEALRAANEALADPRIAEQPTLRALFHKSAGLALEGSWRALPINGEDQTALTGRAQWELGAAVELGALPLADELHAELTLADIALSLGQAESARVHLDRASEIASTMASTDEIELREIPLLATHRWRLLQLEDAGAKARGGGFEQLERAFDALLAQWKNTPHRPGGIGFLYLDQRPLLLSELIDATRARWPGKEGVERALGRVIEGQAMGTLARRFDLRTPSVATVRARLLAEGRGLLVLLPARDRSHLFLLDRDDASHFELPPLSRLRHLLEPIQASLRRRGGKPAGGDLLALRDELLPAGALARIQRWNEAYVVGFDPLGGLPLELFRGADGQPLGKTLALSSLPSLPVGVELARRAPAPEVDTGLLLMAFPEPRGLDPIPFDEDDQHRLTRAFPTGHVLIVGAAAGGASLSPGRTRVLHLLAHGTYDGRLERGAGLVLADGILTVEAVEALDLEGVSLVILSACGAARGPRRVGDDGLAHLGGAFLVAGARCVVLARHEVEYGQTLELMSILHERLAAGHTPAEALRAARAKTGIVGFEVLGLGHAPAFPRRR